MSSKYRHKPTRDVAAAIKVWHNHYIQLHWEGPKRMITFRPGVAKFMAKQKVMNVKAQERRNGLDNNRISART